MDLNLNKHANDIPAACCRVRFNRFYRLWLPMGLLVILATGCGGTAAVQPRPQTVKPASSANVSNPLEQRLRSEVQHWVGTPHRMGGASRKGTDCSGFVQSMYRDIFQQQIPRSTGQQVRAGQPINKQQLRPGDLVFFRIPDKGPHVGIYLGRAEFAHASTSKGVMISNLGDDYWRSSYWTSRRYRIASNQ